jgi:hypothetical protein
VNRREYLRAALTKPVLVDAMNEWQQADCENVSAGGVALSCRAPLAVGKTVELYFELPCGVAIEARAEVIRSSGGHVALRFTELDRDLEIALRAHCRRATMT